MATPLEKAVAKRLLDSTTPLTWSQFTSLVGGSSVGEKARILDAVNKRNALRLGVEVNKILLKAAQVDALERAQTMLEDGALSLEELEEIL